MRRAGIGSVVLISGLALLQAPQPARAADWADRLFTETRHDFGPVPRGAKVRHGFVLNNRLSEPVTIVDIRASCGCTRGVANASLVQPGRSAVVEAEMDTRNFVGKKATVLHVTLMTTAGREAEVRLGVSSQILSDIVLNPGTIDFGPVAKGQTPTKSLTIERIGLPEWRVERMVTTCKWLDGSLVETVRDGKKVGYALKLSLKPDAPSGTIRDEILLKSNDKETSAFPIQVVADVRGDVTVSPKVLSLGKVAAPEGTRGKFLIRATKPFTVESVEGVGDGFTLTTDDTTPKAAHVITVIYRPADGKTRGDVRHAFRIRTDLAGEPPLDLAATLHVEP
jgi:hypothetical protein